MSVVGGDMFFFFFFFFFSVARMCWKAFSVSIRFALVLDNSNILWERCVIVYCLQLFYIKRVMCGVAYSTSADICEIPIQNT